MTIQNSKLNNARRLIFLLIFFFGIFGLAKISQAATINAASCSWSDVTTAYNAASPGDTVTIPASECTWNSRLTISKAITLKGAGGTLTKITNGYADDGLIYISPASDLAIRVTGIYFYNVSNNPGYSSIYIKGSENGSYALTKIRIDNNRIEMGTRCVNGTGWVEGVINNNTFVNCNIAIAPYGDGNYSWNRPIEAGTSHALFIEDNTFTINNNTPREPNEQIYHNSHGMRTVVRYNTFDGSSYTNMCGSSLCSYLPYETHGNWGSFGATPEMRGSVLMEFYNNTINIYETYRLMAFRGGSALVHDNVFTKIYPGSSGISLTEEEAWTSGGPWCPSCPIDTAWPAWDQITNTFFWNNTLNGSPITPYLNTDEDAEFIKLDRDYFLHAPCGTSDSFDAYGNVCTHGKSTYPTVPGKNDMTFSSSGANAYYLYAPYSYPHPLRSETPQTCTYAYSAWGACQSDNTQTRTVISSSPSGCTGTPILTQSCVYTNFLPEQYIEAESGTLSSPMQIEPDSLASGGSYVSTAIANSGSISFTFSVSQAGQYMMQVKINSNNDGGRNSFYVGIDGEAAQNNNYYAYSTPVINGYVWDSVNRTGNGTTLPEFDPMTWDLTAGLYTFTFYGREANTWLDQIILKRVTADTTPPAAPTGVTVN